MRTRLWARWIVWRDSLWFFPAVFTAIAAATALALIRVDEALAIEIGSRNFWLFGGSVDGARGVLQAIAGSVMTVTGTVFSITIVALQLASTQFTPRVLRTFTGDRGVQVVLGVFIGTFTYALLVLRSVRGETEQNASFVPAASVTVAVLLALASIAALIFYIHHTARLIQVATIMDRVTIDAGRVIDALRDDDESTDGAAAVAGPAITVRADRSGYLLHAGPAELRSDDGRDATAVLQHPIGDFVFAGSVLAKVWPIGHDPVQLEEAVNRACVFGIERTLEDDPRFGIRQLADIAVRALSPGINDPTTASTCIDRLGELLLRAASWGTPPYRVIRGTGVLMLVPLPSFDALSDVAFAQIRHYGSGDPLVMSHLLHVMGQLHALVPRDHRAIVRREAILVLNEACASQSLEHDVERVRKAGDWVHATGVENRNSDADFGSGVRNA